MSGFVTGFDVQTETEYEKAMNRLAARMAKVWTTVTSYDRNGKAANFETGTVCNQEPCDEELRWQQMQGTPTHLLRDRALAYRRQVAEGQWPVPPWAVQRVVCEAFRAVHPQTPAELTPEQARRWFSAFTARFGRAGS